MKLRPRAADVALQSRNEEAGTEKRMNLYEVLECIVIRLLRLSPWRPPPPHLMGGGCHLSDAAGWILVLDHRQAEDRPRTLSSETRVFTRALKSWTLSPLPESTSAPQKVEVPLSGLSPDKLRLMEEVPGINPPPARSVSNGPSAE